jgi:hypothetical protein
MAEISPLRRRMIEDMTVRNLSPATQQSYLNAVSKFVVYAKPPFGGPEQVLAYLGRYTHRVAVANSRLISVSDGKVRFTWKDYRQDANTNPQEV